MPQHAWSLRRVAPPPKGILEGTWLVVRCGELAKRKVQCLESGHSVETAARRMRDHAVDLLAICSRKGQILGTLTAFEIATRVTAESRAAELCDVDTVMTKQPLVCRIEDDWLMVERTLRERGETRAIVVDEGSHPIGMLTLADGPDTTSIAAARTMPPPRGAIRFATANAPAAPTTPTDTRRLQQRG